MINLCIKNNNSHTIQYLMEQLQDFPIDSVVYTQKQFSKYTNIILHYQGQNIGEFYHEVSLMICQCILDIYEPLLIHRLLLKEYFYFDLSDMHIIEKNCKESLQVTNQKFFSLELKENEPLQRILLLRKLIEEYISSHKSIILDGFMRFRLKEYLQIINETIECAVNQFVIDREYHNFIDLVKLYVDSKPFAYDTIYLLYHHGESTLFNEQYEIIHKGKESLNTNYLSDISFSSNDYTLNLLLTLLPAKLIILLDCHEDEFIQTLKLIFTERVKLEYIEE